MRAPESTPCSRRIQAALARPAETIAAVASATPEISY